MCIKGIPDDILAGRLILLIDSVPDDSDLLRELLEMFGAQVITTTNSSEGLEKAQRCPDVIITDLEMPVTTGYDMLYSLKQNTATAQIPVIALTSHTLDIYRIAAFEAGCHIFLIKPVLPTTLLQKILDVLERV